MKVKLYAYIHDHRLSLEDRLDEGLPIMITYLKEDSHVSGYLIRCPKMDKEISL